MTPARGRSSATTTRRYRFGVGSAIRDLIVAGAAIGAAVVLGSYFLGAFPADITVFSAAALTGFTEAIAFGLVAGTIVALLAAVLRGLVAVRLFSARFGMLSLAIVVLVGVTLLIGYALEFIDGGDWIGVVAGAAVALVSAAIAAVIGFATVATRANEADPSVAQIGAPAQPPTAATAATPTAAAPGGPDHPDDPPPLSIDVDENDWRRVAARAWVRGSQKFTQK